MKKQIKSSTACVYLCGPPPMMNAVEKQLAAMHIAEDVVIKEGF